MTRLKPTPSIVHKGNKLKPMNICKGDKVKFFSKNGRGVFDDAEVVIKTVTGPHAADSQDGKEIEYYWFEAYKKGHGSDWISTEVCDVYSCGVATAQECALEAREAKHADNIDKYAAGTRGAVATQAATPGSGGSSSKESDVVPAASGAASAVAAASTAGDAPQVEVAPAVVAASTAGDAPQVEEAPAAPAAAPGSGGSLSKESEVVPAASGADSAVVVAFSTIGLVQDNWNPNKGYYPLDKNVVILDSDALGVKLGRKLRQVWQFGVTGKSRSGEIDFLE
jgi:hypothetical protein